MTSLTSTNHCICPTFGKTSCYVSKTLGTMGWSIDRNRIKTRAKTGPKLGQRLTCDPNHIHVHVHMFMLCTRQYNAMWGVHSSLLSNVGRLVNFQEGTWQNQCQFIMDLSSQSVISMQSYMRRAYKTESRSSTLAAMIMIWPYHGYDTLF